MLKKRTARSTWRAATRVSGCLTKLADHDESGCLLEPTDPPIIDAIGQGGRLAKPKELGLNVHGNSRPNTSMGSVAGTVPPCRHELLRHTRSDWSNTRTNSRCPDRRTFSRNTHHIR